ncbi:heavy metal-binding protein HIP-like [Ruditapes philippinarum]|uniref:heavy metal-binding protein HIP-like n=1 Tax=Ruditapes philippinarum TaxID=129788 RepID=UPI00295C0CBE|nr:heavy metal-binding protein HIP-like [Ruditapes philippinarum]
MLLSRVVFLLFLLTTGRHCEEPRCSKYDFEEKVLEKMVRIEFQMERLKLEVEQCVNRVENIKTEVSHQMIANQQELQDTVTPTVAFKARLNADTAVVGSQTVVFPVFIFKEGDAYNTNTGQFTAPVSGVYMFSSAFCVYPKKHLDVSIMIEGKSYSKSVFYGDDVSGCSYSADTVAIVTAGQKVWVEVIPGGSTGTIIRQDDTFRWNTFSGALINRKI